MTYNSGVTFPWVCQRWLPVLDKYGVTLPLECPLHAARDVFAQQEAAKVHVPPQWTCGLCGKAFYHEAHLDRHLDNRHEDYLNNVRHLLFVITIVHVTSSFHYQFSWHLTHYILDWYKVFYFTSILFSYTSFTL